MLQRWKQELLGYTFAVVHRPNRIMCDVDALSRRYRKLIVAHLCISNILHDRDKRNRPQAYQWDDIISSWKSKMNIVGIEIETCPIFIEYNIFEADIFNPENHLDDIRSASTRSPKISVLITQPMKFIWQSIQITNHSNNYHKSLYYVSCTVCILDTEFPAHEPTTTNNCNPILGRRFGILIEHNKKSIFHAQTVRKYELMHFYSIGIKPVSLRTNAQKNSAIIDNLLPLVFPWHMRKISLTTYWRNQESQTSLHMLLEILLRHHTVASKRKYLLLQLIGHTPTSRTPTPTSLSI